MHRNYISLVDYIFNSAVRELENFSFDDRVEVSNTREYLARRLEELDEVLLEIEMDIAENA